MENERSVSQKISRMQQQLQPFQSPPNEMNKCGAPTGPMYACDRCKTTVKPIPDTYPNIKTHLLAALLFILGLPFFVFLPYCFDCFGKPVSRCPKCGSFMNVPP